MFRRIPAPTLTQKIIAAINAEQEYLALRELYSAILHDQMLSLSPNHDTILQILQGLGRAAREKAADRRMGLFDVVASELDDSQEMGGKQVGKH